MKILLLILAALIVISAILFGLVLLADKKNWEWLVSTSSKEMDELENSDIGRRWHLSAR